MNKNARRKHVGYKYDRAGRIIDGLIDNGRLVLMIAFCLSVAFMMRSFPDTTKLEHDQSEIVTEAIESEVHTSPDHESLESDDRIQKRSDYVWNQHMKCADSGYRARNAAKCEELLKNVDNILEKHNENTIEEKSSPSDGGTHLDHDSLPIIVAVRST